ncbi:MAG: GNAT family N-acetyltransferase [Deltaproteobacteria bacterium]|nr:GNAT family N-acetyltransferase [Deltaproteobacteria bacterium]
MIDIKIVETDAELRKTHRVMAQLRPHLNEEQYVAQVKRQQQGEHYHVVALYDDGEVRAVGGFRLGTSLAWGDYVYVDDLVSDETQRSHGHGATLLEWMGRYGKERGCVAMHLDSGVQRHAAHRFYLRERMDIVFYHFKKAL